MTAKRNRKLSVAQEVEAWAETFSSGHDFFGELVEAGLRKPEPVPFVPPCRDKYELRAKLAESRARELAEAEEAWQRLGKFYLANVWAREKHSYPCWALTRFGEPE